MRKFVLLVVAALISVGCGDGGGGGRLEGVGPGEPQITSSPPSAPTQNAKIELKGEINRKFNLLGNLDYLGELINKGEDPACLVKVVINSENASGELIDSKFTYVHGSTLSIHSAETDSCLGPGEVGGFQINTSLESIPASASVVISWDVDTASVPRVPSSQVMLVGSVTEAIDFFGEVTLRGLIKNDSVYPLISVKISFVAIKDGLVVGTYFAPVKGSSCDATNTCLLPEGSGLFEAGLNLPPSELDSYYYKINYSIAE